MNARVVVLVERSAELIASAIFAAAVAFAASSLLKSVLPNGTLWLTTAICAAGSYFASFNAIRSVPRSSSFPVQGFELAALELTDDATQSDPVGQGHPSDELLLTDEDRIDGPAGSSADPLLLDDVLAQVGPDSRVIRLFDRTAMRTPGQLQSQIDDHLSARRNAPIPDASQALSDALAELRRAIR